MKDELKKEIGSRLKIFRKSLGYTQAGIVHLFNIGRANYSRIEKGEVFPNPVVLQALKSQLNLSLDWLFSNPGETAAGKLSPTGGQRKTCEFCSHNLEIDELLTMMNRLPMVKHAVLSYFLEYCSQNRSLIDTMLKEFNATKSKQESRP